MPRVLGARVQVNGQVRNGGASPEKWGSKWGSLLHAPASVACKRQAHRQGRHAASLHVAATLLGRRLPMDKHGVQHIARGAVVHDVPNPLDLAPSGSDVEGAKARSAQECEQGCKAARVPDWQMGAETSLWRDAARPDPREHAWSGWQRCDGGILCGWRRWRPSIGTRGAQGGVDLEAVIVSAAGGGGMPTSSVCLRMLV